MLLLFLPFTVKLCPFVCAEPRMLLFLMAWIAADVCFGKLYVSWTLERTFKLSLLRMVPIGEVDFLFVPLSSCHDRYRLKANLRSQEGCDHTFTVLDWISCGKRLLKLSSALLFVEGSCRQRNELKSVYWSDMLVFLISEEALQLLFFSFRRIFQCCQGFDF